MFKNRSVPGLLGVAVIMLIFVGGMLATIRTYMGPDNFDLAIKTAIEGTRRAIGLS